MPDHDRDFTQTNVKCLAFCPKCGADLMFVDNECICKTKGCGWYCTGCREDDDV